MQIAARLTRSSLLALTFAALCSASALAQSRAVPNPQLASKAVSARVESLLKQMTLEEKIGQLVQEAPGFQTGPGAQNLRWEELTAKGQIGSMLNLVGVEAVNHYQQIAVEKSRLHIPLIFGLDVIHGHRTIFPVPLALAASWDPETAATTARFGAVEARADGVGWVFSPMVDIARDARWGRIIESAGEDPYLGSAMARAWVRGYQQDDLTLPGSVAACVKHFAAYGAAIAGRDYNAVDMGEITLRQVYLEPYRAAVEAGVATVMSSFNTINGVPATANPFTLTQVLRKEWGFDGLVVSDWQSVIELEAHSIGDGPTVARRALVAGLDMDMASNLYGTVLASQVRAGRIPESVVDESVRRILRVKFAMGLFEHPYAQPSPVWQPSPEGRAAARRVAAETLVLLKNDPVEGVGALLPLAAKAGKVALIGPLADNQPEMLGAWAGQGDPKTAITLRAALAERLGSRLLYAPGCALLGGDDQKFYQQEVLGLATATAPSSQDDDKSIAAAVETARQADVAILALGESGSYMEGEAGSRAHLGFTGVQQKLLEAVVATGKPVILVVVAGRPLELTWAAAHVPAMVEAWSPGMEGGHAVADVLFGDVNPSGKLPVSLPRAVGQEPLYYAQMPTGRPAAPGTDLLRMPRTSDDRFVSRYIDEENAALFPFGWGLSYTRFSYAKPTISHPEIAVHELTAGGKPAVTVGVDVKNTGSVAGTEVVQLYIRNTNASVEQPVRELKGFARVTLAPGETKHLEFPLGFNELNFYNVEIKRVVEPTTYKIWVGGSSLATAETELKVVE